MRQVHRRVKTVLLWILAAALAIAAAVATNGGGLRSAVAGLLSDEARNQIIATTSRLNARSVETADYVPVRNTGINPLGVNVFLEQEVEVAKRRQTLQMVKDAGIGWIRQQFPWEDLERPSKGRFWDEKYEQSTWDKYDNIVKLAWQYGLQLIVRLDLPPRWAHPGNDWAATPPDNFEDYGDFVHAVVSRYRGKVKYYQLWNEPNLAVEWGRKPVDAREYVRLLKIGYEAAKQADPDVVILSAALAPTIEETWQALSDQVYLQQMYDAGAKPYFDIMSVMAYGLRSGPDDRRLELRDVNMSRPMLIREIMVRNGDASKAIWASEMGWNVQPASVTAEPIFGRVSEDLQARYTVRAFQRAAEEWPWMGVMAIWFFKRADEHEKDQPFYYFRLVDPDFTPRPVYEAVKALGSSPLVMNKGYSQETHRAIGYAGAWRQSPEPRASLGGVAATEQPGASASFQFRGTDLDLVVPKGPGLGSALVEIDGSSRGAGQLRRDSADRAVLDLHAPTESWQEVVPIARGLTDAVHTVEIKTNGPFALDGAVVKVWEVPWIIQPVGRLLLAAVDIAIALAVAMSARRRRLSPRGW